jgi:succinate dehydrogenase/fumarate reductase flavoprotein subunit
MIVENIVETDVLIIGGGISGTFAAIKAREEGVKVTVVDKGYVGKAGAGTMSGNTSIFNPEWGHNLKDWTAQIAESGDYMNNREFTEITLKESFERYQDLLSWGVKFPTGKDGNLIANKRGVLENFVVLWRDVLPYLRRQVLKSGATIIDRTMVTDLLKQDGRVIGAVGFHTRNCEFYVFKAKLTVICTSGGVQTMNGSRNRGLCTYEGEAMAFRAGAEISGKEFSISGVTPFSYAGTGYGDYGDISEGPTRISLKDKEFKTLPVGFRYDAGKYIDSEGYKVNRNTFVAAAHQGRAPFYLNLYEASDEERQSIQQRYGNKDDDMTKGGLYKAPVNFDRYVGWALHCASGIVSTDTNGGTTLPGLLAAGDVYNSRTNGAKYPLGGFGTRNAMVVGTRAGQSAAECAKKSGELAVDNKEVDRLKTIVYAPLERKHGFDQDWIKLQLKTITYPYYILIVKHEDRLKAALTLVEFVKNHAVPIIYAKPSDAHGLRIAHEAKGSVLMMEAMLRASLFRTESRGVHFREDYPFRDDPNWLAEVRIKEKDGQMELAKKPFPKKDWPDLSIPYDKRYLQEYLGEEPYRKNK